MINARWFIALLLVTFALSCAYAWKAMAQAPGEVAIAGFACQNGVCVTTEAQLENMMRLWYLMQQRILDCPRGKQI